MQKTKWVAGIGLFLLTIMAVPVFASVDPSTQTSLFVTLQLDGSHEHDGDTFHAVAVVENIGANEAKNVHVYLQGNYPEGWTVTPEEITIPSIPAGESQRATFTLTRNETDATLLAFAQGVNTLQASSDRVKVPIHPLVMAGLIGSMGGLFILQRKKKETPK